MIGERPSAGKGTVGYDDRAFLLFKKRAAAATGIFRSNEPPAVAWMPEISAKKTIIYA
jgi:hypothetical protein